MPHWPVISIFKFSSLSNIKKSQKEINLQQGSPPKIALFRNLIGDKVKTTKGEGIKSFFRSENLSLSMLQNKNKEAGSLPFLFTEVHNFTLDTLKDADCAISGPSNSLRLCNYKDLLDSCNESITLCINLWCL